MQTQRLFNSLLLILLLPSPLLADSPEQQILSDRNVQAPFPYRAGSTTTWPILSRKIPSGTSHRLTLRSSEKVVATGETLQHAGLSISLTSVGQLQITHQAASDFFSGDLELTLTLPDQTSESQTLQIRPAPPERPICYYADLVDDLINIFSNPTTGEFAPLTKNGFDQYFRRLQAHGARRLIVWLSPFPYIADSQNYSPEDWALYVAQTQAILKNSTLSESFAREQGLKSWEWLRFLMAARLNPEFGSLFGTSAQEHGISLTLSYRPFEAALTKYYEVPSFDPSGKFLGTFIPLASLTTNHHSDLVGWKHYRQLLSDLGYAKNAQLGSIELTGLQLTPENSNGFHLTHSPFPPLAGDSLVLLQNTSTTTEFELQPYATIHPKTDQHLPHLPPLKIDQTPAGARLSGLDVPLSARYLILTWDGAGEGPLLSNLSPLRLFSQAGTPLGRETTYWVQSDLNDPSRVAPIMTNGEFRSEFDAAKQSQIASASGPERVPLKGRQLVIDLGDLSTVEILDFNQPLTRQNALREIQTILQSPGFDEIFINTRSHVDLPLSMADGTRGMQTAGNYWKLGPGPRHHLGLDKAYAPQSPRSLELIANLAQQPNGIERITTWQGGEWEGACQSPEEYPWRFARNRGTADGLRLFFEDLERTFPRQRIRAVIPHSAATVTRIKENLETLQQPSGGPYGADYYHRLWPSNNHIPGVGEGLAMIDFTGLRTEPVFLGSGGYLDAGPPFDLHVRESIRDLADNRGSSFRGPRSYFFEAQFSLRATNLAEARKTREQMVCHLLQQSQDINEVILYEAADWLYFYNLADPDLCGQNFLDQCLKK